MTLSKTTVLSYAALFVFLFTAVSFAQEKVTGANIAVIPQAAIKTADGFLFVHNTPLKSFTIEIKGKEVTTPKNDSGVPMFFVDGKLLQIVITDITPFAAAGTSEEAVLQQHMKWESDFLSGEYEKKLEVRSEKVSIGERKTFLWGFTRPKHNENFDRDYFLTTTFGMTLLAVGTSLKPTEDLAAYRKLLTEVMSTLKVSDKPFDILKIAGEVKKSTANEGKPSR